MVTYSKRAIKHKLSSREIGLRNEWLSRRYFQALNYRFISANLFHKEVEIDLIMRKGNRIICIEIKTSSSSAFASSFPGWLRQIERQKRFIQQGGLSTLSSPLFVKYPYQIRFDLIIWMNKKKQWYQAI